METGQKLDLREISQLEGLDYIETTSKRNGYPNNIKGAIIGFDTFERARELADRYGLSIEAFEKRNGWALWHRTGATMYEPYHNSAEDFGDNYSQIGFGQYESEEDFIESEVEPYLQEQGSFDNIEYLLKNKREVWEEVEKLEEGEVVITNMGEYYDTIKSESMYFHHDTKHYVIGLMNRN